jgi:hypothetical protein
VSTWRSHCFGVLLLLAIHRLPLAAFPPAIHDPGVVPSLQRAAERAGLRVNVLRLALQAHARAIVEGASGRPLLTVIDFSLPSRVPRLWVLDLARDSVLARELVAHGRGTGGDFARYFSNRAGSLMSSLGTFVTGTSYQGKHGLSLRLRGLDPGLNDRAQARGIVMHGADYVAASIIPKLGRLGRSQGCPALSRQAAERIIPLVQGGTVVYAYYPSPRRDRTLTAQ